MIPAPFLLYLGHSADPLAIKTSRGVAMFRSEDLIEGPMSFAQKRPPQWKGR